MIWTSDKLDLAPGSVDHARPAEDSSVKRRALVAGMEECKICTYAALELADEHGPEKCTGILRVSDILESLGSVLAGLGDQNLVTTGVLVQELADVVDLAVDEQPEVVVGVVLLELLHGDLLGFGHFGGCIDRGWAGLGVAAAMRLRIRWCVGLKKEIWKAN